MIFLRRPKAKGRVQDRFSVFRLLRSNTLRLSLYLIAGILAGTLTNNSFASWRYEAEIILAKPQGEDPSLPGLNWVLSSSIVENFPSAKLRILRGSDGQKMSLRLWGETAEAALQAANIVAAGLETEATHRVARAYALQIRKVNEEITTAARSLQNRNQAVDRSIILSDARRSEGTNSSLLEETKVADAGPPQRIEALQTRLFLSELRKRRTELAHYASSQLAPLKIASTKLRHSPIWGWPSTWIFAFFAMASLTAGLVATVWPLLFERGFLTRGQLQRATGQAVLGVLPEATRKSRNPLNTFLHRPASELTERFRALRTALLLKTSKSEASVIMITSSCRAEGASTTALLLAQTLANWGGSVLLIDADARNRSLSAKVGVKNAHGILSVLAGICSLKEAALEPDGLSIDVLVAEDASAHAGDILVTERFANFLTWARDHYDHILIDTPPVETSSATLAMAKLADQILYQVHWKKTHKEVVESGIDALIQAGGKIGGLILARQDSRRLKRMGFGQSNDLSAPQPV